MDCFSSAQKFSSCFLDLSSSILIFFFSLLYLIYHGFRKVSNSSSSNKSIIKVLGMSQSEAVGKMVLLTRGNVVILVACALLQISSLAHTISAAILMEDADEKTFRVLIARDSLLVPAFVLALVLYWKEIYGWKMLTSVSLWFWGLSAALCTVEGCSLVYYHLSNSSNSSFWVGKVVISFTLTFLFLLALFFGILTKRYETMHLRLRALREGSSDSESALQQNHENISSPSSSASNLDRELSFWDRLKQIAPFMWPKGKFKLKFMMFLCLMCLAAGRVVNVFVPLQYKIIVDSLTPGGFGAISFAWGPILIYVLLRFVQGSGGGLIGVVQNILWIRVGQHSTREISVRVFEHLHSLSLQFHLNRKTGEVLRVMDRGTASIVSLLNSILFNILPTIVDITVACFFFVIQFDGWFGLVVFITMTSYIGVTILITEWRTKYRKLMNELENRSTTKAVDSLLNFETVKYYGAEAYEVATYGSHVRDYQHADWLSQLSLNLLNFSQNVIISVGLAAGSLICAWQVVNGILVVGDFVLFLAYITQLYVPLNWFGTFYRVIQQNIIDMEKMLDLLHEKIEVEDKPDAPALVVSSGHVKFDDVSFSYGKNVVALKGISFEILPGQTVALVGSSGGGKSTILRLLFRFYDIQEGRISIDGQDVKNVTSRSLRSSIGVVPQDTVLFNDTIKYNIGYGRIGASDEEIMEAAKAAQIHDKIMTFPEGYETRVGERGLRLSGGEKQRVAIARTILKDPRVIVLDEATSALDTNTERHIQSALRRVTENRTTLIIAHRLSTIMHADRILVLDKGSIVEQGSHDDLLKLGGLYSDLWRKQIEQQQMK